MPYGVNPYIQSMYGIPGSLSYMGMVGSMAAFGGLSSPFGISNIYYPLETAGGLTYQVPFMQIAPLLGVAGLYSQLFPNLF